MDNITVLYTDDADITEFRILNFDEIGVVCVSIADAESVNLSKGDSLYYKQLSTGFSCINASDVTEYYYLTCGIADDLSWYTGYYLLSVNIAENCVLQIIMKRI